MIDRDSVPSTVESAARQLSDSLTTTEREPIRTGLEPDHFGAGLPVRNAWSLWETDSALKRDAVSKYGIVHADDISGLIRAWAMAIPRGEELGPVAWMLEEWQQTGGAKDLQVERILVEPSSDGRQIHLHFLHYGHRLGVFYHAREVIEPDGKGY